jgi:hypothetical protein
MANVQNSFIKSKLNKDLDARLIPNGEYRDAKNVQVSRSDGSNVGSLENVLGNKKLLDFETLTSARMVCIGTLVSESTNEVYLFLTSYVDPNPTQLTYNPSGENYIIVYNSLTNSHTVLVKGPFLNFSTTHEVYHANLLEDLLFWTDNRNQPRKINVNLANPSNLAIPTYYTTEDQISVAKYNPFQPIQLWQKNLTSTDPVPYETTMKDVTSKVMPNGATATAPGGTGGGTQIVLFNLVGEVPLAAPYGAASVGYIAGDGNITSIGVVNTVAYNPVNSGEWTVALVGGGVWPSFNSVTEIIFNANPYYDKDFAGDPNFLEDKFVRFSYRFKFDDNEYSLMAPFTQVAFIPKQDGYFMYVQDGAQGYTSKDDQAAAYRSTVVSFVENKADAIKLLIPLPFTKSAIVDSLKIAELDILYKESDALAIKVIETVSASELTSGTDSSVFEYDYLSKKPYKVLPSSDTTRVYDKVPVRAFAQETSGNRIIYGNFQTKHTPPATLDYNVAVDAKADFNLQTGTALVDQAQNIAANTNFNIDTWTPFVAGNNIVVGMIVSETSTGTVLGTVSEVTSNTVIKIDAAIDLADNVGLTFDPAGPDGQTVSKVEYPNHSLKQNRNYQVGVVLSDRYGRTSTVILSRSNSLINGFRGDTIYSPYLSSGVEQDSWPGESLKMLFNSVIGPTTKNVTTGEPGIYNGDVASSDYNPLGWYSYKIVVKQTEQEYYNVYLPGIMASYPQSQLLELGKTSHAVLLNDNINKVPRDLNEVGPDQKQFRSSVKLFGRVENTATAAAYNTATPPNPSAQDLTNAGKLTDQYYPGTSFDTASTISTLNDLFEYNASMPPVPNYFGQFYLNESNPLVARISTSKQIGQTADENYSIASATVVSTTLQTTGFTTIQYKDLRGTLTASSIVSGIGVPDDTTIDSIPVGTPTTFIVTGEISLDAGTKIAMVPGFPANFLGDPVTPPIQYLAVYETEPVESLLDIFWESTSTGEVNELNTLILNATGGGAGLINTSTSDWDESYALNDTIFNNNFQVVNSFGTPILPSTSPISLVSVTLDSVIDGNGTDVLYNGTTTAYFELFSAGTGLFNIRLKESYIGLDPNNGIYFGQDSLVRNFRFNIVVTTSDGTSSTSTTYPINAGPKNVSPNDANPGIVTQPNLSGNPTIHSNRSIEDIATCVAANGSSKGSLKAKEVSWTMVSAFEASGFNNYPSGADLSTNQNGPILFSATNTEITSGTDKLARGVIKLNSTVFPSKYNITIGVNDAEGGPPVGTEFAFTLQLHVPVTNVYTKYVTYCTNIQPGGGCDQGDSENSNVVVIEVTASTVSSQNGFYAFDMGSGVDFQNWAGTGGIITLDRTNAATTTTGGNLNDSTPAYGGTGPSSEQNVLDILESRNFYGNATYTAGGTTPDISAFVFEIV